MYCNYVNLRPVFDISYADSDTVTLGQLLPFCGSSFYPATINHVVDEKTNKTQLLPFINIFAICHVYYIPPQKNVCYSRE
jgi:hypothetical protein